LRAPPLLIEAPAVRIPAGARTLSGAGGARLADRLRRPWQKG